MALFLEYIRQLTPFFLAIGVTLIVAYFASLLDEKEDEDGDLVLSD